MGKDVNEQNLSIYNSASNIMIVFVVLGLGISIILGIAISRYISGSVKKGLTMHEFKL